MYNFSMGQLRIYRRHTLACTHKYPQNRRLYQPRTKREENADCDCPIVATGPLRNERRYLQHVSLETNDWHKAEERKAQWERWQALSDPKPGVEDIDNPTIEQVVAKFLSYHGPALKDWEESSLGKYRVLLLKRLLPYCEYRRIRFMREFDRPSLVNDFVTSWVNLNPTHNKKTPGEVSSAPLKHGTKIKELERWRYVIAYCVQNGWVKENHAKNIKLKYQDPDPKFGLELSEVERVLDATKKIQDGNGRTGQYNADELHAFCLVSRYTGLRISDVTTLDETQLVQRESGNGWAIKVMVQKKTKRWVRVPVPVEVYEALKLLKFKGERAGKHYWFWTGEGNLRTAIGNWRERMTTLFHLAQDRDPKTGKYRKPFAHHASPHTWRHTFAILHLNAGTDVKWVSTWLGHKSMTITLKHYAHAIKSTHIASEAAYDKSMRFQQPRKNKTQVVQISGGKTA